MLVRLIEATPFFRGWQGRLPGAVIELTDGVANTLIRRGIAALEKPLEQRGKSRAGNRSHR